MPSPKSGSAGTPIAPAAPDASEEADIADPGEVEEIKARQREQEEGKYGTQKVAPFKPDEEQTEDEESTWIEIELLDSQDNPVPGELYRVVLPDGRVASGVLDANGFARLEGVPSGTCQVSFPGYDGRSWDKA